MTTKPTAAVTNLEMAFMRGQITRAEFERLAAAGQWDYRGPKDE